MNGTGLLYNDMAHSHSRTQRVTANKSTLLIHKQTRSIIMYVLLYKGYPFQPQRTLADCFVLLCEMGENDIKQAYNKGYEIILNNNNQIGVS